MGTLGVMLFAVVALVLSVGGILLAIGLLLDSLGNGDI